MKVYIVVTQDCEDTTIKSIHKTYEGALKSWDKARLGLIRECYDTLKVLNLSMDEDTQRQIDNLSCKDPDKIDNYPQETPRIMEMELEE